MLIYDEYREGILKESISLKKEDFFSEFHKRVFEAIMQLTSSGEYDFSLLGQFFTAEEIGRLEGLVQKRRGLTENSRDMFLQCVQTLKKEKSLTDAGGTVDEIMLLINQKRNK
jgi:replicative DNA helicase